MHMKWYKSFFPLCGLNTSFLWMCILLPGCLPELWKTGSFLAIRELNPMAFPQCYIEFLGERAFILMRGISLNRLPLERQEWWNPRIKSPFCTLHEAVVLYRILSFASRSWYLWLFEPISKYLFIVYQSEPRN